MTEFYASKGAELAAVRRAAARSGCRVNHVRVGPGRLVVVGGLTSVDQSSGPLQVVGSLSCSDGWQAARFLLALSIEDSKTPGARALAAELREGAPSDDAFARAVHAFVLRRVRFVRERGEIFQSGAATLNAGFGDCDDHARLVYALAVAGGLQARLGLLHHGAGAPPRKRGPAHAVAVFVVNGRGVWAETTCAAEYGESPNVAARRLGLTNERTDIAKEVLTMSESDLAPIPAGFLSRNAPDQVARDAAALVSLGYLEGSGCSFTDPTDPTLRRAVDAFQRDHGLERGGLLGPRTRHALATSLEGAGAESDYATLSGLDTAPPPGIFTHAEARAALREAYAAQFGREPTKGELDFGLATAYFETFYGRGGSAGWANRGQFGRWAAEGKINWGALQSGTAGDEATMASFRAAGLHPTKEPGSDAARPVFFYLFPNDVEAARAFLMSWGKADTLAAAASGSATAVSAAMKRHGYYEGFHVGPGKLTPSKVAANMKGARFVEESSDEVAQQKNVGEYAAALSRLVATVNGAGGVDSPPRPPLLGGGGAATTAAVFFLLSAITAAGAAWETWR